MRRNEPKTSSLEDLRRRAELSDDGAPVASLREPLDATRLAHELSVHEIEIRLQNEELRATSLELERSRDRYFELYDLAPTGYLTVDRAGSIGEANAAATTLLGFDLPRLGRPKVPTLIGRKLPTFMARPSADAFHISQRQAREQRVAVGCEVALQRRDGGTVPVHVRSKALWNADGQPDGFLCMLFDLSELRHTEERLRAEEARTKEVEAQLLEIAQHLEDALMLREPDGRFSYVSPGYERIWGRPAADLVRDRTAWETSVHAEDRERVARAEARLQGGEPFEETYRVLRPDGEVRWVRARFIPNDGDRGKPSRTVGIAQDITAQRALEEDLRQAQKLDAIGRLSNAIAHDFGNLLQGIMGCAIIALSEEVAADRRREYLERVVDAVKRGSDLVGQLMTFSRKKDGEPRPVLIDDTITGTARLIEQLVGANIRLDVRTRAPEAVVLADPAQIEQILINLAANARDAMPKGGTLHIETDEDPKTATSPGRRTVRLCVRDTGVGIDERTKARIFEPFFTTKPVGVGTGIGLSTVLAITRSLGGHVDVEGEPGGGTSFVFHFPCTEEMPAPALPVAPARRFGGRTLLVEDNPLARTTIRHFLEELGLEVLEAPDVGHALELAGNGDAIDVCVSDVTLSDGTGPKLVSLLRQRHPSLRSLYISAHPRSELTERGLLPEMVPVLRKPFGKQELAAGLAALLSPA